MTESEESSHFLINCDSEIIVVDCRKLSDEMLEDALYMDFSKQDKVF